jgi:multiple antibiotic resistance protein
VKTFLLAFIPLFVAIDVLGVLPLFVALTEELDDARRRRLAFDATATAFAVSLLFLIAGKGIFTFLGITESDFRVGGGIILIVLAVSDLLFAKERQRGAVEGTVGVVPIGIPLIMGPAALTTIILQVGSYGYLWTIISLLVNLLIVLAIFTESSRISKALGKPASRAIGKVAALLLAGIGIMMIRSGVAEMIQSMR